MTDIREAWRALGRQHAVPYDRPQTDRIFAPEYECASRAQIHALQGER